jgi:hypothetical protein
MEGVDPSGRDVQGVRLRPLAGSAGSDLAWGIDVCCEYCVLSGRGLCDGRITRPEESERVLRIWM